jgi:cystathionine gamma-synthase
MQIAGSAMNVPITLTSTYVHGSEVGYARDGNESWFALEAALSELDGGHATIFSSGLAAATAIASLIPLGGKVVVPNATYFGVKSIFQKLEERGLIKLEIVDGSKTENILNACEGTSIVWLESIANPTMLVSDIPSIAQAAHAHGALVVVDSTFATPLRQKPLDLGADIVLHSATKYIGGHSDLLLGVTVCKSTGHAKAMASYRHDYGATPGALETYLALRGLRTLAVRLDRAEANAMELAKRLAEHAIVSKVNYPGLIGNTEYEIAQRVLPNGASAMLSFELRAEPGAIDIALEGLKLISHATSLGGVESLIERRARYESEASGGVPLNLVRFSVGIENVDDLWNDLTGTLANLL